MDDLIDGLPPMESDGEIVVTCGQPDCGNFGVPITLPDFGSDVVHCGPCGKQITDIEDDSPDGS